MFDKEQVLKIAKECGATHPSAGRILMCTQYAFTVEELEAFAAAMYAAGEEAMRERAAKILDDRISATVAANEIRALPITPTNTEGEQ